jgi:tRNA-dihydrouridine synthase
MNILDKLPRPFFVLAPMDDVTDTVFRQVIADCAAPDLYFTEFVNVDGLQSPGRPKLMKKLQFSAKEKPIIAQVWGLEPENYRKTAVELVEMGFAGIDINMGCPEKTVVKNGACAGLMHNRELAVEIIQAVQEGAGGKVPVSVKTRLGFNEVDYTWPTLLLQQKLSMLTIHGRTRKEMSKVPAQWEEIGRIRELRDQLAPGTLIVGNGDVENREQGLQLAKQYKLDGIMIGRGVFHDPFAFSVESPWTNRTKHEKLELYTKHVKQFAETWQNGERPVHTLNKFCKIYINGFDGAKELREHLMAARSTDELINILEDAKKETVAIR